MFYKPLFHSDAYLWSNYDFATWWATQNCGLKQSDLMRRILHGQNIPASAIHLATSTAIMTLSAVVFCSCTCTPVINFNQATLAGLTTMPHEPSISGADLHRGLTQWSSQLWPALRTAISGASKRFAPRSKRPAWSTACKWISKLHVRFCCQERNCSYHSCTVGTGRISSENSNGCVGHREINSDLYWSWTELWKMKQNLSVDANFFVWFRKMLPPFKSRAGKAVLQRFQGKLALSPDATAHFFNPGQIFCSHRDVIWKLWTLKWVSKLT